MKTYLNFKLVICALFSVFVFASGNLNAHESAGKNQIHSVNINYELYNICKNDVNGFSEQLGGGMYGYPSLRHDIREAMIARSSTGKAGFEFLTSTIAANYKEAKVNFFFYSDIDLNIREPYDITVNGKALLTFKPDEKGVLQIIENSGNGDAKFYLYRRDGNGDGIGAFRLSVPATMIVKGEKAKISVTGQAKGVNGWFMLFKIPEAITWLSNVSSKDVSFSIKQFSEQLLIDGPAHLAGQNIFVISDGKKSNVATFKLQGELAKAAVKSKAPKATFQINYGKEVYAAL